MNINKEVETIAHRQLCQYEPKPDDTSDVFIDSMQHNPGLRLRIRDALSTVDIHPEKSLDLGYSRRSHIDVDNFYECIGVNPHSLSDNEKINMAKVFLSACCQLRDGISGKSSVVNDFEVLPEPLKVLSLLKLIDGSPGTFSNPEDLVVGGDYRIAFNQFVGAAMPQMTANQVEGLIDASTLIHAPKIINELLRFAPIDTKYLNDPALKLKGMSIPSRGLYLGDQLEDALKEDDNNHISSMQYWANDYHELNNEDLEMYANTNAIIDRIGTLSEVDPQKMPFWRDYVLVKLVTGDVFKGQKQQGFSASIDQFVSWTEPKPDKQYPAALVKLKEALKGWEAQAEGSVSREALACGLHSFCIETIEDVERSIVYDHKTEVKSRIATIAIVVKEISATNLELAESILSHSSLLQHHIEYAMDPWQTRYR